MASTVKFTKTFSTERILDVFRGTKYDRYNVLRDVVGSIFAIPKTQNPNTVTKRLRQIADYIEEYWSDSSMSGVVYSQPGIEIISELIDELDRPAYLSERVKRELIDYLLNCFYDEEPASKLWNDIYDLIYEIESGDLITQPNEEEY